MKADPWKSSNIRRKGIRRDLFEPKSVIDIINVPFKK